MVALFLAFLFPTLLWPTSPHGLLRLAVDWAVHRASPGWAALLPAAPWGGNKRWWGRREKCLLGRKVASALLQIWCPFFALSDEDTRISFWRRAKIRVLDSWFKVPRMRSLSKVLLPVLDWILFCSLGPSQRTTAPSFLQAWFLYISVYIQILLLQSVERSVTLTLSSGMQMEECSRPCTPSSTVWEIQFTQAGLQWFLSVLSLLSHYFVLTPKYLLFFWLLCLLRDLQDFWLWGCSKVLISSVKD